jgi:hypothetical protein
MGTAHFHDHRSATREKIREQIEAGRTPVVQFRESPDAATLDRTNGLCQEFGPDLQVRFFEFGWRQFDTSLLVRLPNVANLSIDCMKEISDFAPVAALPKLTRLRFAVHEHPDGRFLEQLDLPRFTHLTLGENKRRNFDLSVLGAATALEQLFVQGHDRGVESIGDLQRLAKVSLSGFPKRHDLAFLNDLAALRSLLLILGSRQSIAEFNHSELLKLRIVWVRMLDELGPLERFKNLEELVVEDQLRLARLDISGLSLRRLTVSNCKSLERIDGLEQQTRLVHLSVSRTKLRDADRSLDGGAAARPVA